MEKEESNGCSSLGYKLLFSCPFGLSPPQLSVVFDESYDRIPHSDVNLEKSISEIWDQRVQKNASLFNGKKFRYGGYSQKSGDGSSHESYVCLHLGLTDYRTFVGTNLSSFWEKFLVASEDDSTQCQHTSSPIETHKNSKDRKDFELVNKRCSEEMFDSIIREVVEEIGVPTTSLSDPLFIGISRRVLNVRPAIFFFIKCSLESKEIQHLYSKAQDGYESTQLCTVSMTELEQMTSKMPGCHQGGFALYKLMVEASKNI